MRLLVQILGLGIVATLAPGQQPATPYLFVRLNAPRGSATAKPGRPPQVSNTRRIALEICIRTSDASVDLEQPEIEAVNQAPDYFKYRPPANIVLQVRQLVSGGPREAPFRVYSPGGGKDLDVYYVNADIDILEDKNVRRERAARFVEWIASQAPFDARSQLLRTPGGKDRLVDYFEEQYVNNPPGEYEIIAQYTPSTAAVRRRPLVSAPFRIVVVPNGDFFDGIKAELATRGRR